MLRNRLVVVLAVTSGGADALGFLALGNAFTSVMTGNMVLFGVATAHRDSGAMALTAVAIGAFVAGAAPAYAPCAPAYAPDPAADDASGQQEPGFWRRLFGGGRPEAPSEPAPPQPPAP